MDKTELKQIVKEEMQKMLQEADYKAAAEHLRALGASLAGRPDLARALERTLKEKGFDDLGKALIDAFIPAQAKLDSEYAFGPSAAEDDYDD